MSTKRLHLSDIRVCHDCNKIVSVYDNHIHPSDPILNADGSGVTCYQCMRRWNPGKGEKPDCEACAEELLAVWNGTSIRCLTI